MTTRPSDRTRLDVDHHAITSAVERVMTRRRIPGLSLAIADATGVRFATGFGKADLSTGAPATDETSYLWFSLSKIVTATAAVRLADEGRLDLAAPVSSFLPGIRADRAGRVPTVANLLDHTAGLRNPLPIRWVHLEGERSRPSGELVERLLRKHGASGHRVGGRSLYSNLSYLVLGEVIAEAAGEPFEEYGRAAVLEPAGMHHTGFAHHPHRVPATGYVRAPRAAIPALKAVLPPGLIGSRHDRHTALRPFYVEGASYGGLVGDVTDAGRLMALHLADGTLDHQRVVAPASARRMRTISSPGRRFDLGQGWFREAAHRQTEPQYVQHLGVGGGFYNAMRLYPDHGIGIVVMTNNTASFPHHELLEEIREAAFSQVRWRAGRQ